MQGTPSDGMGEIVAPSGRAIVIAGPTASGKSALALAVAERLGGTIINADSMQVYADLQVLTARPTADDMARVPHRLFGHVDAAEAYSVGRWLAEIGPVLDETWTAGRVPVVVGGTGLYLKALTQGLSDIPAVPDEVRAAVRATAEGVPPQELHRRLQSVDPVMAARLRPTDPQRIVRALEVFQATGRSLSTFQDSTGRPLLEAAVCIGLALPRDVLSEQIDRRVERMMTAGTLDEVERLSRRGLNPSQPAMRALGVSSLAAWHRGEVPLQDAILDLKASTRRYAKRQMTFLRTQLASFSLVDPHGALASVLGRISELDALPGGCDPASFSGP